MGRLEIVTFEPIKSKYEWIINQTKVHNDMIIEPKDQCNDDIDDYMDFSTNDIY